MATFKFYNIQLLPTEFKTVKEVGATGYCKLFNSINKKVQEVKQSGDKLSSIAAELRGDMYFSIYSATEISYDDTNKLIHGYFLKFDDVDELLATDSGALKYKSTGNTCSKRHKFEFVFDPNIHVMAIQCKNGLPARKPLIEALFSLLDSHSHELYPSHCLDIEELTSADSINEFFNKPKKGITSFSGQVTFSNSDDFDDLLDDELRPLVKQVEKELKEKNVASWSSRYTSFKGYLMSDLPMAAKAQMCLAAMYGNATASYTDNNGKKQKYQMDDYPVKDSISDNKVIGNKARAFAIAALIPKAKEKTRIKESNNKRNKSYLDNTTDKIKR